jgi:hypothetical protein|tara:strand:- start:7439 stop:8182 length:744 start_codon:yes stop_codon:yes gene_type:complete
MNMQQSRNVTRDSAMGINSDFADVYTAGYDSNWTPVTPSMTPEIHDVITSENFQARLLAMLEAYDELIPEDSMFGDTEKYIPLSLREDLFYQHFGSILSITYNDVGKYSNSEQRIVVGTVYVRVPNHNQVPWFSVVGVGSREDNHPDGLSAAAEASATKRILVSLGLGDDPGEEMETMEDGTLRNRLSELSLKNGRDGLKTLLKLYNDAANKADKIAAEEYMIGDKMMDISALNIDVVKKLVMHNSN